MNALGTFLIGLSLGLMWMPVSLQLEIEDCQGIKSLDAYKDCVTEYSKWILFSISIDVHLYLAEYALEFDWQFK